MFRNGRRNGGAVWLAMASVAVIALAGAGFASGRAGGSGAGLAAASGLGQGGAAAAGPAAPEPQNVGNGIAVGRSYKNDVSRPLRDMPVIAPARRGNAEEENENPPLPINGHTDQDDPVVQRDFAPGKATAINAATVGVVFAGINQAGGCGNCAPPDTNGDVGPNHYMQAVNSAFAIYSKTGALLYGPAAVNSLWQGFGGACETRNDGDPVVLYDSIADRWLVSQFTVASPYDECIAVSTSGDPTGSYYRYAFQLSASGFPDYPKLAVWPDGYHMTVNWFAGGTTYAGPRPYAFDRAKMLVGQPATFLTTAAALGSSNNPMLPADLDGPTLPPAGQPDVYAQFGSPMSLWKFKVDFANPANASFAKSSTLAVAGFNALCATTRNCVKQPGVIQKLDGMGDRLMHRLSYRNMGGYQSLLASHSVRARGTWLAPVAGMRWYEIRNPAGAATIYQQGTYSPDTNSRWMGGLAMNKTGAIALGYSVSSGTVYPSIRVTGRVATDPLGTMPQGETSLFAGTGVQSGVNRWGDYSAMSVDPSDDCTFWYTQEFNNSRGWAWGTRIGSFKLPGC